MLQRLQTTPWLSLLGYGVLIIFYGTLASLCLPAAWRHACMRSLLAVPLILVAAKDLASFPLCRARWQAASTWRQCLAAALPPEFLAYLRLERAMWRSLLRRPLPTRPDGIKLGYLERGSYGTVICCVLVGLLVEAPIDVLIASVIAHSPEQARLLHVLFAAFVLYSLVWVLGDRWYVTQRRHHILTATTLELDIGPRGFGSVPLAAIASCERLHESRSAWCRRHGYAVHAARTVSPCDAPNVVILLHPGHDVTLTLWQLPRTCAGPIFLYLDRPELLRYQPSPTCRGR